MSNITTTSQNTFSLTPTSLKEAMEFATMMSKSTIIPKEYQGKPSDILIAIQMGAEVGLKPIQSLQNIATINGRPSIWGDAALALVLASPNCEYVEEHYDEQTMTATCKVKRKNHPELISIFTVEKAKKAKLWEKPGSWQTFPDRMLKMRARGFALRDKFADVLKGLILREEAEDYPDQNEEPKNVTPKTYSSPTEVMNAMLDNHPLLQDDEVLAPEEEINYNLETLLELIGTYNVPDDKIGELCAKAGKSSIEDFDAEEIKRAITGIKAKYEQKNEKN